ncbi:Biopolymer transport protein ExbD [Sporomusa ovata DSM 2662]|uniref:Biopolymer transport protein ExbD/TolR n=1 Tax=Sporomusa ovata TaxID=2378 RepID=A0A0U1L5N4_9FIRM|nr:biopolymer transporter ExbD [Sporomusa ovata]EQB28490.1 biopolymer transport protein [Sporomusa ovata DSM 2662]CQR74815.1 Biopolymer transport protein ExbD/TolR [Sporomusa ovata]
MKIARKPMKKARIEIIPMIDTMFFLLVFFMLATLTMTTQSGLPVNLPQANGVQDETKQIVTLTLTQDGNIFYDKQQINSPAEAVSRLTQQNKRELLPTVIINADRSVEHGRVVELLDAVRQSGVIKVAIAVKPSGDSTVTHM